jgi:hypothetical protein
MERLAIVNILKPAARSPAFIPSPKARINAIGTVKTNHHLESGSERIDGMTIAEQLHPMEIPALARTSDSQPQ